MAQSISRAVEGGEKIGVKRPRLAVMFVFIAVMVLICLFFVWSRIQVFQLQYEISALETQVREAEQDSRRLRLEVASLSKPSRIERIAVTKLGLRAPAPDQIINVR
ncbi:MAG: cell division protein FtsL [Thermodesulfobacteriota bacterium]|jgi:cell division protein FtsL|nr:cell division protein FtsL [Thermodesulfobacteriota bacterium]